MLLCDRTIKELVKKGELVIDPYDESLVGPSSIDLRLGTKFLFFNPSRIDVIDPKKPLRETLYPVEIALGDFIILHPNQFVIATTLEYIKLPPHISARIEGRSSLARLGIIIHSTGGFVDAGFEGQLTLEMSNINVVPVKLYAGMRIAQLAFILQDKPSEVPYNKRSTSKYVGQRGPTPSKIFRDFE